MALYRTISLSFWTDSKVDETFTPEDKYFYLYLLTNPHTSLCGCYEISTKHMAIETGYSAESIKRLLERFENIHHVIRYDSNTKEVLILNWSKYNWTKSQKFLKAVVRSRDQIKNNQFRRYVDNLMDNLMDKYGIEKNAYGIESGKYPTDTSDTVTGTDTNTNTGSVSDTEAQRILANARKGWANRNK